MSISWRELSGLLFERQCHNWEERHHHVTSYLIEKLGVIRPDTEYEIKRWVGKYSAKVRKRWEECNRTEKMFLAKHKSWLDTTILLPFTTDSDSGEGRGGRPTKSFDACSDRTKRMKTESIRASTSTEVLSFATEMSLRADGRNQEAKLVQEALHTTPTRARKISDAWKSARTGEEIQPYSPNEALALIIDTDLTKHSYQTIRVQAKERNADIYPSYNQIAAAKNQCYPACESVNITEAKCEVSLQVLLDLTVNRIVEAQRDVVFSLPLSSLSNVLLVSKWGFDGSSSQSRYKQKSADDSLKDSDLLMTCLVPLRLMTKENSNDEKFIVICQNPRPSSTRFCRPVKLEFIRETADVIRRERENMMQQIKALISTNITAPGCEHVSVSHRLCMSMVDGKVCNAVTNTVSAQRCYMCDATPKDMNNLDKVLKRNVRTSTFEFGLSTLHGYIRFFEWLLHLSYRLTVKSWQRNVKSGAVIDARKAEIQRKFRSEIGLLVEVVKEGSGTTNDGNTARRFFENPSLCASITGIREDLIHRCNTILRTLSCGYAVNAEAFKEYALETAKLYVKNYYWYPMPASVHKIMIHGSDVVAVSLLPIGMLSEEAQEARNKDFRRFKEHHTRKISRASTNEDILHALLVTSDPLISSIRKIPPRKHGNISADVIKLLDTQIIVNESDTDVEDD